MNDIELIKNRINTFWGYGNLKSNIWFIGMEEGLGKNENIKNRLSKTKDKPVVDLQKGMQDVPEHMKWFEEKSKIQRTWNKLIYLLLELDDDYDDSSIEKRREFQKKNLGRLNSNHALLEFMPLPCRSTKTEHWIYGEYDIEYLKTRKQYLERVMPCRIELFRELVEKYNPKIVIFYSLTYLKKWTEIIGCDLKNKSEVKFCKKNGTTFIVIPHPVAHKYKNEDWEDIAKEIKELI